MKCPFCGGESHRDGEWYECTECKTRYRMEAGGCGSGYNDDKDSRNIIEIPYTAQT